MSQKLFSNKQTTTQHYHIRQLYGLGMAATVSFVRLLADVNESHDLQG